MGGLGSGGSGSGVFPRVSWVVVGLVCWGQSLSIYIPTAACLTHSCALPALLRPPPHTHTPVCSTELPPYAHKAGAGRELEQLDVSLTSCLQRLAEHRRRHTMLLAFAQSPVDFVNALVAAQVRGMGIVGRAVWHAGVGEWRGDWWGE